MPVEHKLAIVVSHPIQYFSPLFKLLAKEIELKVFYAFDPNPNQQGKDGFGKAFSWDIDLLNGYEYEFLTNVAKEPTTATKNGCDTPEIGSRLAAYKATHVVVFGWHLKSYLQAAEYCNKSGIPLGVRGDSQYDPLQSVVKRWVKNFYFPFFLKRFDTFFSVGKRNRSYLKSFGVSDDKIIFSPHAVDTIFWQGTPNRNKDKITFLWVAKFIEKKRPLDAIRAFMKAYEKDESIRLQMVGSGNLLAKCQLEAKQHEAIEFLGFKNQTELKDIYLNTHALLLSSDYRETWGLVVNEAFSSGLPAIVSSACGCVEDLIDENTGIAYEFGNINAMSEAILQMSASLRANKESYSNAIADKNLVYSFSRNVESFKQFLNQ